jgi:hypothetical protein
MRKTILPRAVPARFLVVSDPSRSEDWGRLTGLSPQGALVSSLGPFKVGSRILLSWEIHGQKFELEGRVLTAKQEISGYFTSFIFFIRTPDRRKISSFLIDFLS